VRTDGPILPERASAPAATTVLRVRGPETGLPPDLGVRRSGFSTFEALGPSDRLPEGATLRAGPDTFAQLAVGGSTLEVTGDAERGTLVTALGEVVPVTASDPLWARRPRPTTEPPVPRIEVEGGGLTRSGRR